MPYRRKIKPTPEPTIRRLPRYLHLLGKLKESGIKDVSSTLIAKELDLDPTQVRKDIEYTAITGRPKTGYDLIQLMDSIRIFLNWAKTHSAILIGTGNLGKAMLGYQGFKNYGLNFIASFDNNPAIIGTSINNIKVHDVNDLSAYLEKNHPEIAVIAVPTAQAQYIADILIKAEIKAIWNFAPTQIQVPENVIVENSQLSQSLAVLTRKITESGK